MGLRAANSRGGDGGAKERKRSKCIVCGRSRIAQLSERASERPKRLKTGRPAKRSEPNATRRQSASGYSFDFWWFNTSRSPRRVRMPLPLSLLLLLFLPPISLARSTMLNGPGIYTRTVSCLISLRGDWDLTRLKSEEMRIFAHTTRRRMTHDGISRWSYVFFRLRLNIFFFFFIPRPAEILLEPPTLKPRLRSNGALELRNDSD